MTQPPRRVEFRNAPDFAEVAEALGVPTNMVLTVTGTEGGGVLAFYSPDYDTKGDKTIWVQELRRGPDGIFIKFGLAHPQPGMWERMEEDLQRRLGDQ
jgi:hypothetical protein